MKEPLSSYETACCFWGHCENATCNMHLAGTSILVSCKTELASPLGIQREKHLNRIS